MNNSQHDELAALFAQRLNFASGDQVQQNQQQEPFIEPVPIPQPQFSEKQHQEPIHYASAHYNHSYHIRHETLSEPSRSPPPAYHETMLPNNMAQTLRDNSIDPASLLPNQLHLFANADLDQRLRLLELWRISPPSYSTEQELNYGAQNPTSLAQEESSARQRYEAQNPVFDTHIETPRITPIRQAGEPAWPPAARMRAASIASSKPTAHHMSDAEPYIMDGYHQADEASHHFHQSASSVEPVYAASAGLWPGQQQQQQQGIEEQYGGYMQIRNHADWEAMNERIARERFGMVVHSGGVGGDDDMVM
jgi:hypothetical protein